jgi:hypothetical protein
MGRTRSRRPAVEKTTGRFELALDGANVVVPDGGAVAEYLSAHPSLHELVAAACRKTGKAFGPSAELSLEPYCDPETGDRYLTLYVRMQKYSSQFIDRLEAVSGQFEDKLTTASGYFLLTSDFHMCRATPPNS